jgi:DNA-binding NarL/FixJ family response regulator
VAIVDDHPVVCEGLTDLISRQDDLVVCGAAATVPQAIRLIESTRPDLCIVDIALKGGNGIDLIKRLKPLHASVKFLVSSMHEESLYFERALRAGAMGYINKEESTQKIIQAIRRVLDGKIYVSEAMADRLLQRLTQGGVERPAAESLADRELQVFEMIGQGLGTREIAAELHLSPKTVETYRARIREKLQIGPGSALTRQAMQWLAERKEG